MHAQHWGEYLGSEEGFSGGQWILAFSSACHWSVAEGQAPEGTAVIFREAIWVFPQKAELPLSCAFHQVTDVSMWTICLHGAQGHHAGPAREDPGKAKQDRTTYMDRRFLRALALLRWTVGHCQYSLSFDLQKQNFPVVQPNR